MNSHITPQVSGTLPTGDEVTIIFIRLSKILYKGNCQNCLGKMHTPTSDGMEIWQLSSTILRGEASSTKCIPGYTFTENNSYYMILNRGKFRWQKIEYKLIFKLNTHTRAHMHNIEKDVYQNVNSA